MTNWQEELAWRIGGAQGSGVDTAARMFSYACAFGGLNVFGRREYYSNIMGRHSYYDVRVAHRRLTSHRDTVDLLATFDDETLVRHAHAVVPGGAIIYNSSDADVDLGRINFLDKRWREDLATDLETKGLPATTAGVLTAARQRGVLTFEFPYDEVMESLAAKLDVHKSIAQRTLNTVAVAASIGLLHYDPECLIKALHKNFPGRDKIINLNAEAANITYEYVREHFDTAEFRFHLTAEAEVSKQRLLVNGNQTNALGKIAGGLTFQTYYPISPATDESVYLEGHANFPLRTGGEGSVVVVQTEDELAAATMAAGAALTGARSATATSGPGFSLMVEALGWAGINEVPMVFTVYQRGSPSTGMPTRTEQGDLQFVIHAGHGESPRLVMASADIEESFYDAAQAFNYAERYQMPVIHLLDKGLASTTQTLPPFDVEAVKIARDERAVPVEWNGSGSFPRFNITESGVSPRSVLGQPGGQHWLTGGEHTVLGRVTEDPVVREQMMEKRARKLELAAREIPVEEKLSVYGDEDAALTVMSWGQTKGAILEALEGLQEEGIAARLIHVRILWPFPTDELQHYLETANPLVVAELNFSGQFATLLREMTGRQYDHLVVKYNGRPFPGHVMLDTLKQIADGNAERRIVVRNPFE